MKNLIHRWLFSTVAKFNGSIWMGRGGCSSRPRTATECRPYQGFVDSSGRLAIGALLLCALTVSAQEPLASELRLPRIFAHNMVVQRDQAVKVWGWAHPGEQVVVAFKGVSVTNRADWHGCWSGTLGNFSASAEPAEMTVTSGLESVTLTNVLVGEVWLASGQSNMFWPVSNVASAEQEIASADDPELRLFTVQTVSSLMPLDDLTEGRVVTWTACRSNSVRGFSAVAYFFARDLRQKLGVPVGVIVSAWGDTCAESWTPLEVLEAQPLVADYLKGIFDQGLGYATNYARFLEQKTIYDVERQVAVSNKIAFSKPAPRKPMGPGGHNWPGGLWNAMIKPLCGYTLRGVIWYQGEANVWRSYDYRTTFPLLIQTWRERWGQGDFAFYWVQLANYKQPLKEPAATRWAELREAQTATLALSNTAQALAIDLADADNPDNIHPKNKQEVGRRLALQARKNLYGESSLVASGPRYLSQEVRDGAVVLTFDANDDAGLVTKDGGSAVTGFAIAGADRKWSWATATLGADGKVTVSAPSVPNPVAVRYGFEDNPAINLYNRAGLPATPFRTDDWGWFDKK